MSKASKPGLISMSKLLNRDQETNKVLYLIISRTIGKELINHVDGATAQLNKKNK